MDNQVISWLLEESEPSVRCRTLTELLDYPADSAEVVAAKAAVSKCKNVERIFARRDGRGVFPAKPEYFGNWTTFIYLGALAELGVTGDDPRVWPVVDWILTPGDDADKHEYFMQKELAQYAYILDDANLGSCRQGGFLATLVRLGYLDDPRVRRLVDVYIGKGRWDGGYLCKWKKSRHAGQEPKSCYSATLPALWLYAALPASYRSGEKYEALIEYFTGRDMLFSKLEPGKRIGWDGLAFNAGPSDILKIAYSMGKLGLGNIPQMKSVWDILDAKPTVGGKYILERAETKKAILMDKQGEPSKWITLYVLLARKYRDG